VVRGQELGDLVRTSASLYAKFGLRNAPAVYPSGHHLEPTAVANAVEKVHRAAVALEWLDRMTRGLPSPSPTPKDFQSPGHPGKDDRRRTGPRRPTPLAGGAVTSWRGWAVPPQLSPSAAAPLSAACQRLRNSQAQEPGSRASESSPETASPCACCERRRHSGTQRFQCPNRTGRGEGRCCAGGSR